MRSLPTALLVLLAACTPGRDRPEPTCDVPCGDACCEAGQECDAAKTTCVSACQPNTCEVLGRNCGPVDDGCGHTLACGECTLPATCGGGGQANVCGSPGCTPVDHCADLGRTCGTAPDDCDGVKTCGTCADPATCGGAGIEYQCGEPACEPTTCEAEGKDCGRIDDHCGHELDCGSCTEPATCGGSGTVNLCGRPPCLPFTCEQLAKNCGLIPDGCNGVRNCGSCSGLDTCGGGGAENVCGHPTCLPVGCGTRNCGEIGDGCGHTIPCGSCSGLDTCGGGGVTNVCGHGSTCVGESNASFCTRLGKQCGTVVAKDNCNATRTVECGSCAGVCLANNQCCVGETAATLCQNRALACGTQALTDQCGTARTVDCGTCSVGTCSSGTCVCSESDAQLCARLGNPCGTLQAVDLCGSTRTVTCTSCGEWALRINGISATQNIQGISGTSDTDVWAAGYVVTTSGTGPGVLYHWNGEAWGGVNLPVDTPTLWAIRAYSPTDVWASGQNAVLHFDGNSWSLTRFTSGGIIDDVFATNGTDALAVGQAGGAGAPKRIWRGTGGVWALDPTPPDGTFDLHGVWSFSPSDSWVVGNLGYSAHWNGAAWASVPTGTSRHLRRLWGTGSTLFAPGAEGIVLRLNGGAWEVSRAAISSEPELFAIAGSSTSNVWAAGNGVVMHYDGSTWTHRDPPANPNDLRCGVSLLEACPATLRGAWVSPSGAVWVVGKKGYAARRAP